MSIYKFRSLINEKDCDRLKNILETGHFWCSNFWELNDPMEGVFNIDDKDNVNKFFNLKEQYKICSFSGIKGFENLVMWGYYATGFKGVAIEVEIEIITEDCQCGENGGVKKIECDDNLPNDSDIEKILLNKNTVWEQEDEYRFLIKSENNNHKIGKITTIYFGNPYGNIENKNQVREKSTDFSQYEKFKEKIIKVAKGMNIFCWDVKIEQGKIIKDKEL